MAKNKNKKSTTKEVKNSVDQPVNEAIEVAQTEEVVEVKNKDKKAQKATSQKKKAPKDPNKKSRIKETFGELKKVTWPSFGKAMKQTGMVLTIVLIFGIVTLGIDLLISLIISLLSSF